MSAEETPRGVVETLQGLTNTPARELVAAFGPGAIVAGVTVVALVGDDSFMYPLVAGPTDAHVAELNDTERRLVANLFRRQADRWEPTP